MPTSPAPRRTASARARGRRLRRVADRLSGSLVAAIALGGAGIFAATGAAQPPLPRDAARLEALTDSLRLAGNADSSLTLARAFQRQAMQRADTVGAVRAQLVQTRMLTFRGRAVEGEQVARETLLLARTSRDGAHERDALMEVGNALEAQGRPADALVAYREVAQLAVAAGDAANAARARMYQARFASNQGRFQEAHDELAAARAIFDSLGLTRDELNASNLLGITRFSLMDLDGAAECFRHCAELGRELGNPAIEGRGWNNLARVEYSMGDPGAAERHFETALELQRKSGSVPSLTLAMLNVGEARARMGRYSEAVSIVQEALALAQQHGLHASACAAHCNLGYTRWLEGRNGESAAHYREAIAQARRQKLPNEEVNALLGVARALAAQDSVAAAYELLARRTRALRGKVELSWEIQLDDHLASFLTSLGRHQEAVPLHRDVAQRSAQSGFVNFQMMTLANLSDSYRGLDLPDSALAVLTRGARVWESARAVPLDPRWREERGSAGRHLYGRIASLLLDYPASAPEAERTRQAFDAVQVFKARTLLERMLGPGGDLHAGTTADTAATAVPVTLAEVQQQLLAAGELLLDYYAGPKETVLFAVTCEVSRAHRLPESSAQLTEKLDVLRGLMNPQAVSAAGRDPAAIEQACRSVGRALFGPVADLIAASQRVLLAADGPIHLVAVAALIAPTQPGDSPLVQDKELVRVPSATVLAQLRRSVRERAPAASPVAGPRLSSTLLALAGETAGEVRLPAAVDEVRALGRQYRDVEVRVGSAAEQLFRQPQAMGAYDVLHLAAHADVDDENPWRSGIILAATPPESTLSAADDPPAAPAVTLASRATGPATAGESALRAANIAGLPLKARLAVLSACNSAGGRVVSGEGVLGLTGAFLAAGVPTVVATLWPVDDRTTSQLMAHLYRHLAQGASAAAALRDAQLAVRDQQATSDPFYWAGFVLVGEGDTTVPLRRRSLPWISIPLVVGVVVALWTGTKRRSRGRA